MDRVIDIKIIFEREAAHFGMRQHGRMLARAVIVIGRRFKIVDDQFFQLRHIPGQMRAALQAAFFNPNFFLELSNSLDVHVAAFMGGTGKGQLAVGESKIFHTAALHERKHLEGLGAGAQKSDHLRVAIGCNQGSV